MPRGIRRPPSPARLRREGGKTLLRYPDPHHAPGVHHIRQSPGRHSGFLQKIPRQQFQGIPCPRLGPFKDFLPREALIGLLFPMTNPPPPPPPPPPPAGGGGGAGRLGLGGC